MLWRRLNMGPIEDGGDAGIDGTQRANQVPGIHVLRAVDGREDVQDERQVAHIALKRIVYADVAQDAFPQVAVCIHKARHDDHVRGINDFGIVRREVWPDRRDFRSFDQHIGAPEVAERAIQGNNTAVPYQGSIDTHELPPLTYLLAIALLPLHSDDIPLQTPSVVLCQTSFDTRTPAEGWPPSALPLP